MPYCSEMTQSLNKALLHADKYLIHMCERNDYKNCVVCVECEYFTILCFKIFRCTLHNTYFFGIKHIFTNYEQDIYIIFVTQILLLLSC